MVDSIKISYKLTPNETSKLESTFDTALNIGSDGRLKSEKHYKNESFGYTLNYANDLVPFDYLTIDGSLSKQVKGDNWRNHRFNPDKDSDKFYNIINSETGLEFGDNNICFISRFDVGLNLVDIEPNGLIAQMYSLSPSRMSKHIWDESFRIGNKTRQLRVYDKAKEILSNTDDEKIKLALSGKILSRIETQLVKNKNIQKKHDINTIADIMDIDKQKVIFFDTYNKIIKVDKIKKMDKEKGRLTLNQFGELQELKTVMRDFGDLESYRKFLLKKGYDKGGVSRKVSRLRNIIQYLEKDTFISLSDRIDEEIKRLENS